MAGRADECPTARHVAGARLTAPGDPVVRRGVRLALAIPRDERILGRGVHPHHGVIAVRRAARRSILPIERSGTGGGRAITRSRTLPRLRDDDPAAGMAFCRGWRALGRALCAVGLWRCRPAARRRLHARHLCVLPGELRPRERGGARPRARRPRCPAGAGRTAYPRSHPTMARRDRHPAHGAARGVDGWTTRRRTRVADRPDHPRPQGYRSSR